jgi:hypothetical protein
MFFLAWTSLKLSVGHTTITQKKQSNPSMKKETVQQFVTEELSLC